SELRNDLLRDLDRRCFVLGGAAARVEADRQHARAGADGELIDGVVPVGLFAEVLLLVPGQIAELAEERLDVADVNGDDDRSRARFAALLPHAARHRVRVAGARAFARGRAGDLLQIRAADERAWIGRGGCDRGRVTFVLAGQ